MAHGAKRIVRVGTHTGTGQLRSRLRQHFLVENKDRSIFRKNIGRALLNRDHDPFLPTWDLDRTSRLARETHIIDLARQSAIEALVSFKSISRSSRFALTTSLNAWDSNQK